MCVSVCICRSSTSSPYYVFYVSLLHPDYSRLFPLPTTSCFFQVRWFFSYAARFAQLRKSLHSLMALLLLQEILSTGRSIEHTQKLSTVRLRSFLLFPSPSRASDLLSHFLSITSEFASDNPRDKEAAVKHCAALGVYVRTFWGRDIFVRQMETPDDPWCTEANVRHLKSLNLASEGHRNAREFLNNYAIGNAFRKHR